MTVVYLASDRPGLLAGELIFTFGLPATGLICLIAGLLERSRRRPPFPPPYNTGHPPPPPMGYPGPYPALNIFFHAARAVSSQAERARNTSIRVGECVNESTFKAEHFTSGPENNCANPSAVYELAFKGGRSATCPDGKRDHSLYDRFTDDDSILCFAFNLKEGQCYQMPSPGAADMTMRLGDCQSHSGALQVKVVQRIDGSTDKTQCPPGDKAVSYPVPARVYCLARADS